MKSTLVSLLALAGLTTTHGASILSNGDFESATGPDLASWAEIGAIFPNAPVGYSTVAPASGSGHAAMSIDNTTTAVGAAVFIEQVTPFGSVDYTQLYDLTFDARVENLDFTGINVFAQVLFLDQDGSHGGGVKGEILQSLVGTINDSYQSFSITGLSPLEGADAALVRFQLAAGAIPGINNSFYVDNASFGAQVPEPSSAILMLSCGILGLVRRKR